MLDALATKLGRLSSVGSQIVMSYVYDVTFGIHNHGPVVEPLAQVLMNKKEMYGPNTPHTKSMRDFRRYRIHETFGITWLDWLELPLETAEDMIVICKESMDQESVIQNQAANELKSLMRKQGT